MEAKKFELPSFSACSFKPMLHEEYEAIRRECEPWILALSESSSPASDQFVNECLFPLLGCLTYATSPAHRVVLITKFIVWVFTFDDEFDDPSLLGATTVDAPVSCCRHQLILSLVVQAVDDPQLAARGAVSAYNDGRTLKSLHALQQVIDAMFLEMSATLQARFLNLMKDYLNAVALQSHYRSAHHVPDIDEYIAIRRPASLAFVVFLLIEYGLGIELDEETLNSNLMANIQEAVARHVALSNDVLSCQMEIHAGDYLNLPSIIAKLHSMSLRDALQRALDMVEDVDRLCVSLMGELQESRKQAWRRMCMALPYGLQEAKRGP